MSFLGQTKKVSNNIPDSRQIVSRSSKHKAEYFNGTTVKEALTTQRTEQKVASLKSHTCVNILE